MAAASIRACFVTLRPQHGGELPAELRFAPELQLQLLGAEARGGVLGQDGDALTLRRERSGVYCTAATGELSFQPERGASAELPFRLLLGKTALSEGELVWAESEPPRLALRSAGAPTAEQDAVDLELVVLVTNAGGQPTAVAASLALAPPVAAPVPLPGAFLRTSSGRGPALEPIDEDRGVRSPRRGFGAPSAAPRCFPAASPNCERP